MKFKIYLLLLALIQFALCKNAYSTTYYVSTTGNDANAGTLAAPYLTLAKAISKAIVAGDTIFVRSGTYPTSATVSITKTGTAAKHIVLSVYPPDMVNANSRPVFDFSAMPVASGNIGIKMGTSSVAVGYWDIYGIIIKGAGDNGMLLQNGVHHTKIEFCSFTRNRDTGLQIRSGTNRCLILNCDSYENADLGAGTTTLGGNADGFAPKLDIGDSVIFRGCRAWMNSDDGWDGYLKSTSTYPDGITTIVEDCWAFHNGYYWLDGSTTTSENGNGFKTGGSDLKDEAHNFVLTKCLSFRNKAKGFDQNNNAGSIYVYNCSAHSNGDVDYGFKSTGVTYASGAVLVLKNNLSLGSKGVAIRTAGTTPTSTPVDSSGNRFVKSTTSTNFISLDSAGATAMRNLDGSLPSFTNQYMHLQTSPASSYIDAGTSLSSIFYHDAANGIPYNGSALDIGVFETVPAVVSSTYTFNGNGNWNVAANWLNSNMPPATVTSGSQIIIDPSPGGQCILNIFYKVAPGATLTVMAGKTLVVQGDLTVVN
ncbi:DUF1565 domain-containing protein [Ferruginibacter lapsinanis]|uniref:right-handed parallel beta-helix repeat-containing protein n=1 Tax=Ferruginibacter lapsinanis TaxID=563172 RepID=UPI001E4CC6AC|nr:right-handed parallel beta-helix repeat-containing protein [Ferruginibacter lapsinanis]UEG49392.1 DUF1565 domain-containing protein [Ferruginibacter lapsinanis]